MHVVFISDVLCDAVMSVFSLSDPGYGNCWYTVEWFTVVEKSQKAQKLISCLLSSVYQKPQALLRNICGAPVSFAGFAGCWCCAIPVLLLWTMWRKLDVSHMFRELRLCSAPLVLYSLEKKLYGNISLQEMYRSSELWEQFPTEHVILRCVQEYVSHSWYIANFHLRYPSKGTWCQ